MTVPDQTRPSGLSDSQHLAIDVLLTGGTHREAAEAAGAAGAAGASGGKKTGSLNIPT